MANRVVLDPVHGLKISTPGVDVLAAANTDLLMDPRYSTMTILQAGSIAFPGDALVRTIPYTRTFTSPPVVFFFAQHDGHRWCLGIGQVLQDGWLIAKPSGIEYYSTGNTYYPVYYYVVDMEY